MSCHNRNHMNQLMIFMIVAIIAFAFFSILFGGGIGGEGMMGGGMMGGMMGFGWLFMLLPVIFVIFLIYALLDRDRPSHNQPPHQPEHPPPDQSEYPPHQPEHPPPDQSEYPPPDQSEYPPPYQEIGDPMLVLEHRYASGEISREDYLRIRKDLERR